MIETLNGVQLYFEVHGSWSKDFQLIVADMRGHGRSSNPSKVFRHQDSAADVFALLDHLKIGTLKGLGVSGGGSYFPAQARPIMRQYPSSLTEQDWEMMRRRHPGGDARIKALLASTASFADSYDDMNFTPPYLSTIQARTLIVQGDRDPLYPVEISVEIAKAIPRSSLWIVPNGGHGPIGGERWPEFVKTAAAFLRG